MAATKKIVLCEDSLKQISKTIALANMAARAPKEKNPSIPMTRDERYYRVLARVKAGETYHGIK